MHLFNGLTPLKYIKYNTKIGEMKMSLKIIIWTINFYKYFAMSHLDTAGYPKKFKLFIKLYLHTAIILTLITSINIIVNFEKIIEIWQS